MVSLWFTAALPAKHTSGRCCAAAAHQVDERDSTRGGRLREVFRRAQETQRVVEEAGRKALLVPGDLSEDAQCQCANPAHLTPLLRG